MSILLSYKLYFFLELYIWELKVISTDRLRWYATWSATAIPKYLPFSCIGSFWLRFSILSDLEIYHLSCEMSVIIVYKATSTHIQTCLTLCRASFGLKSIHKSQIRVKTYLSRCYKRATKNLSFWNLQKLTENQHLISCSSVNNANIL